MAITLTYDFTANTLARAAHVQGNFDTLESRALDKTGDAMTGLLDLSNSAAGQIKFPATQNASTNANTLDDYEESLSFQPNIGGSGGQSGQVYTAQLGTYVKIGRFVAVSFRITLSTLGTITTSAQIQGLPFTIASGTAGMFGDVSIEFNALTTSAIKIVGRPVVSTTTMDLFIQTAAATGSASTALVQADLSDTTSLRGQFWYIASA